MERFVSIEKKQIDESIKLVEKAKKPVESVRPLSADERRRTAKLRRGAQQVIPTLAHLGKKFGLDVSSMPIDGMLEKLQHAERLRTLLSAITEFHKLVNDEILQSEADAWETATVTYATLRRAAKSRPLIAKELAPVKAWFDNGRRKKATDAAAPSGATPTHADGAPAAGEPATHADGAPAPAVHAPPSATPTP